MQAAIFDMDGLLVDTEPFWQEAELEIFPRLGVPLTLEMCLETVGLRIDEVVKHWQEKYPWSGKSIDSVAAEIVEGVAQRVREKGELLPGAREAIILCREAGLKTALASSSNNYLIGTILDHFDLKKELILYRSAEDDAYGKPHPAVFLRTASDLEVAPNHCVVFEDSIAGLIAAKAAKMRAIGVPNALNFQDKRFVIADVRLDSLTELTLSHITGS